MRNVDEYKVYRKNQCTMILCRLNIFFYCMTASLQFTIKEMDVPTHVALGSKAHLSCRVDTGNFHQLASLKWYKDDVELCRFTPLQQPTIQSFYIPGLADSVQCKNDSVEMSNVSMLASGLYKCEASSEAPTFRTVVNSRNVSVMVYPTRDPVITGLLPFYYSGENIEAKCRSSPSNPPPKLRWLLNGVAIRRFISNDITKAVYPDGLFQRSQELRLVAQPELFTGDDRRLTVMCESTLPGLPPWQVTAKVSLRIASLDAVPAAGDSSGRRHGDDKRSETRRTTVEPRDEFKTAAGACTDGYRCLMKNQGRARKTSIWLVMISSTAALYFLSGHS